MLTLKVDPQPSADLREAAETILNTQWNQDLAYLHDRYDSEQMEEMKRWAEQLRQRIDTLILVGVGGSNGAARAVIEALKPLPGPEVVYAGLDLSPVLLKRLFHLIEHRQVGIIVIAKNFQTLEPGLHFRLLRDKMRQQYGVEEAAARTVVIGTPGERLEQLAKASGYGFFAFEKHLTGRFSAFHAVTLFPLMVAGVDVDRYLTARTRAFEAIQQAHHPLREAVLDYCAYRQQAYRQGKKVEIFSSCDAALWAWNKWWVQLFGESEGTQQRGLYPDSQVFSEDLHSMGQFIQAGSPIFIETLCSIAEYEPLAIPTSPDEDEFDYLETWSVGGVNQAMVQATWAAHRETGMPAAHLEWARLDEQAFATAFMFFLVAVVISSHLTGVSPYEQYGVEAYKRRMIETLKREASDR